MKFGTQITTTGTRFRLWAPQSPSVSLKLERDGTLHPMRPLLRGWHELELAGVGHGDRYRFVLRDGTEVPDPASRFQPEDVLGPSEVVDPRLFPWTDVGWAGRPWVEAVVYELHIGTFTPEGTFRAAMDRLDYLAELGVTAIQLMPVNDFPGRWNWGYDGALPFAPDSSYGRPDDLKALIDAAHARNLMVLLDVVYNHFGPKGNFLPHYAPVLNEEHSTPWGSAVNFDGVDSPTVRELILANARYWLTEYHFDGLRLDAVHEIKDEGFNHVLHDIAVQIRLATEGRHLHLVVENETNDPEWLRRTGDLATGLYDAQWNDDFHHVIDVALYGEESSYQQDYGHKDWLGRTLATGFGFQGEGVPTRKGKPKGAPSGDLPPVAFISFLQNHDQIGNRLFGERIASLAEPHKIRAAAAIHLLSPQIPMLFMGEEWASRTPFMFFSDVDPAFADDIAKDRMETFGAFVLPENKGLPGPDSMAESTFEASKLDWTDLERENHRAWLDFYRRLIEVRLDKVAPHLAAVGGHYGRHKRVEHRATWVEWRLNGAVLTMLANLSDDEVRTATSLPGDRIWVEGSVRDAALGPWSVVFSLNEAADR